MKIKVAVLVLLALTALASISIADDEKPTTLATIDNFSIIVGHWVGEGFGGVCEEAWRAPSADVMIGSFKLIHGGKLTMFEMQMISEDSLGWALGVKHFNPDMSGWEEKAEYQRFDFVSASETELVFQGLTYKRVGADSLIITVGTKTSEGSSESIVRCKRKPE